MTELALKTLGGYLLGSVLGSDLLGWLTGRTDLRARGSGNPGSTNALRAYGKGFALGVAVIDVSKGWIATAIVPVLALPLAPASGAAREWLPAACGAAVMLGHVYPVWSGLRGGKAVATLFGALLGLAPGVMVDVLIIWAAALAVTGFVGLASMAAAASLPLLVASVGSLSMHRPLLGFALFAAVLILFTHRANIGRMRSGQEPRIRRPRLPGRRVAS